MPTHTQPEPSDNRRDTLGLLPAVAGETAIERVLRSHGLRFPTGDELRAEFIDGAINDLLDKATAELASDQADRDRGFLHALASRRAQDATSRAGVDYFESGELADLEVAMRAEIALSSSPAVWDDGVASGFAAGWTITRGHRLPIIGEFTPAEFAVWAAVQEAGGQGDPHILLRGERVQWSPTEIAAALAGLLRRGILAPASPVNTPADAVAVAQR